MNEDVISIINRAHIIELDDEFHDIVHKLVDNPKFSVCWGGLKGQHHDFEGGLARHTKEVIDLCFDSRARLNLTQVDDKELFFAALFHDAGKMFDYEPNPKYVVGGDEPAYTAARHKRMIHHISRSALIWSHAVVNTKWNDKYHDSVLHAILSHHGQREWGSPVAPRGYVAWLVHLNDGISARMNDCERLDRFGKLGDV